MYVSSCLLYIYSCGNRNALSEDFVLRLRIISLWQMQGLQTQTRHVTLRPNLQLILHHNHGYYRRCRHKKNCRTNDYSNGNGESLVCNHYKLVFHATIQHLPACRVPGNGTTYVARCVILIIYCSLSLRKSGPCFHRHEQGGRRASELMRLTRCVCVCVCM